MQAAVISIDPVNGVYVRYQHNSGDYEGDNVVDGSGLTGNQHGTTSNGTMWADTSGSVSSSWIVFDLGAVYTVGSFNVWNYNSSLGTETQYGVNEVTVNYGTALFGEAGAFGSTVAGVTNFSQAPAPASTTYTGENFNAFTPFNAQYIAFDIGSSHGATAVGLAEVQFDGTFVSASTAPVEITGVTVESYSSQFSGREAANTIGAPGAVGFGTSGLNVLGHHTTVTGDMWLTNTGDAAPEIVYDLGAVVDLVSCKCGITMNPPAVL